MAVKSLRCCRVGIELDELNRLRVLAGIEHDLCAVAQQVERLAIGRELVRMRHRLAQCRDRELCLRFGLYVRVDPQNRGNKSFSTSGSSSGRSNAAIAASSR